MTSAGTSWATHQRTDIATPRTLGCIAATLVSHRDGCIAVPLMPHGDAIPRMQTMWKTHGVVLTRSLRT